MMAGLVAISDGCHLEPASDTDPRIDSDTDAPGVWDVVPRGELAWDAPWSFMSWPNDDACPAFSEGVLYAGNLLTPSAGCSTSLFGVDATDGEMISSFGVPYGLCGGTAEGPMLVFRAHDRDTLEAVVFAFDPVANAEVWSARLGKRIGHGASPLVLGGQTYVPERVDATGVLQTAVLDQAWDVYTPLVSDGRLVAVGADDTIACWDSATGESRWESTFPNIGRPVTDGRYLYFAMSSEPSREHRDTLVAIDLDSGESVWSRRTLIEGEPAGDTHPWNWMVGDALDGVVYVGRAGDVAYGAGEYGAVVALDAETGDVRWSNQEDFGLGPPRMVTYREGSLYLAAQDVYVYDAATGDRKWSVATAPGPALSSTCRPLFIEDLVVFYDSSDGLFAVRPPAGVQ